MCIDSPVQRALTSTPSLSLFVERESDAELNAMFQELAAGGSTSMPPGGYDFSRRFTCINDRYGVSWQLNAQ